jgi:hypothetical protein
MRIKINICCRSESGPVRGDVIPLVGVLGNGTVPWGGEISEFTIFFLFGVTFLSEIRENKKYISYIKADNFSIYNWQFVWLVWFYGD